MSPRQLFCAATLLCMLTGCNTFADLERRYPFDAEASASKDADGPAPKDVGFDADSTPNPGSIELMGSWVDGIAEPEAVTVDVDSPADPTGLWLAFVVPKPDVVAETVEGLGATWTRVAAQCAVRETTRVEIWYAIDAVESAGVVSATFVGSPASAAIAVVHLRGAGVPLPLATANTLGLAGDCPGGDDDSGDTETYSIAVPEEHRAKSLIGAIAFRNRVHGAGDGFEEELDFSLMELSGSASGVAVFHRLEPTAPIETVEGVLGGSTDWAAAVLAVEPR